MTFGIPDILDKRAISMLLQLSLFAANYLIVSYFWELLIQKALPAVIVKANARDVKGFLTSSLYRHFEKDRKKLKKLISIGLYATVLLTTNTVDVIIIKSFIHKPTFVVIETLNKVLLAFIIIRTVELASSSNFLSRMVRLIVVTFSVITIFGIGDELSESLSNLAIKFGSYKISAQYIIKLFCACLITLWLMQTLCRIASSAIDKIKDANSSTKNLLTKISNILIGFIVLMVTLQMVGVDVKTLAVFGSAVGLGVGFGLQKIASNFISGIILLIDKSIQEGDFVQLDNGMEGTVRHLGMRYTVIETGDLKEVLVPNEELITHKVINLTYTDKKVLVHLSFFVDYSHSLHLVLGAMQKYLDTFSHKNVLPECRSVLVKNMQKDVIEISLSVLVKDISRQDVAIIKDEIYTNIVKIANLNSIKFGITPKAPPVGE